MAAVDLALNGWQRSTGRRAPSTKHPRGVCVWFSERAEEEKVLAEWQAAHTARLERLEAEERREAEMVQRMCEAAQAAHAARRDCKR